MKNLISGIIFVMGIGTTTLVFAQSKTPVPIHPASNWVANSGVSNSPTHLFNLKLKKTLEEISKDEKSDKLTQNEARTEGNQVKAIRVQELQFFKENGNKQLTSNQLTQLNQSLSQVLLSI